MIIYNFLIFSGMLLRLSILIRWKFFPLKRKERKKERNCSGDMTIRKISLKEMLIRKEGILSHCSFSRLLGWHNMPTIITHIICHDRSCLTQWITVAQGMWLAAISIVELVNHWFSFTPTYCIYAKAEVARAASFSWFVYRFREQ